MARSDMKALTPFGIKHVKKRFINGININEEEIKALASIGCSGSLHKVLSRKLKKTFNMQTPNPGQSVSENNNRLCWTAQGQWILESDKTFSQGFDAYLIENLGKEFAITDQTSGWIKFSLSGNHVLTVLERCIMLDVHEMTAGAFNRCSMEHIGIYLLCEKAKYEFSIYGPRSFAQSLYHSLTQAIKSI